MTVEEARLADRKLPGFGRPAAAGRSWWCGCRSSASVPAPRRPPGSLWCSNSRRSQDWKDKVPSGEAVRSEWDGCWPSCLRELEVPEDADGVVDRLAHILPGSTALSRTQTFDFLSCFLTSRRRTAAVCWSWKLTATLTGCWSPRTLVEMMEEPRTVPTYLPKHSNTLARWLLPSLGPEPGPGPGCQRSADLALVERGGAFGPPPTEPFKCPVTLI